MFHDLINYPAEASTQWALECHRSVSTVDSQPLYPIPDHLSSHPVKNFETKCEGLSPGLFVFAISGNITYALSIVVASIERQYLVRNGSWLAGTYYIVQI
jgi:hypothetical protein